MESLQKFEFFEELSDEQLMSISGGVDVSSSSGLGSLDVSLTGNVVTFQSNSSAGTGTTNADLNNLTITTKRPGVTDTTIQLKQYCFQAVIPVSFLPTNHNPEQLKDVHRIGSINRGSASCPKLIQVHQASQNPYSKYYKTFKPEEARRLLVRLEIHHTPKHGSWLNMAEIELQNVRLQP